MSFDSSDSDPGPKFIISPHVSNFHLKDAFRNLPPLFKSSQKDGFSLDLLDAVAVVFLTAIGMLTRVFRIQFPKSPVFDETHFGTFTNDYLKGEYFHDIHPPLAKMIMAGVAHMAGYNGEYAFRNITEFPSMTYVSLRMTPAFFGALCVPLAYLTMRVIRSSHFASFVASILVASDLLLIIEARHILSDGILHFFCVLAIFSIFLHDRVGSLYSFIFEGLCLGFASSCKYTSGGIVLLALFKQFDIKEIIRSKLSIASILPSIIRCIILCGVVLLTMYTFFVIHLEILPYKPRDDCAIPNSIRPYLIDRELPDWQKRNERPLRLKQVIDLMALMHETNTHIASGHPYSSPWYSWALCTGRWLLFWTSNGKHLICLGNILTWWPAFFVMVWNLIRAIVEHDLDSDESAMLIGYLFSYLPFALVPREMFIYHYAIPLIFAFCGMAKMIECHTSPVVRGFLYSMAMTMAFLGYIRWNPWAYGLTTPEFQILVWNKHWVG